MSDTTREDLKAAIVEWIAEQGPSLPPIVRSALESYLDIVDSLDAKSKAMKKILGELRKAFGITPKSEKRTNYGLKGRNKALTRGEIEVERDELVRLAKKHGDLYRRHNRRVKFLEDRLKSLDEIVLSEEEEREIERESKEFDQALQIDNPHTDLSCAVNAEQLMTGNVIHRDVTEEFCPVDPDVKARATRTFIDQRERLDLSKSVIRTILNVEQAEVKLTLIWSRRRVGDTFGLRIGPCRRKGNRKPNR